MLCHASVIYQITNSPERTYSIGRLISSELTADSVDEEHAGHSLQQAPGLEHNLQNL